MQRDAPEAQGLGRRTLDSLAKKERFISPRYN
jgi:hypothetical protein